MEQRMEEMVRNMEVLAKIVRALHTNAAMAQAPSTTPIAVRKGRIYVVENLFLLTMI